MNQQKDRNGYVWPASGLGPEEMKRLYNARRTLKKPITLLIVDAVSEFCDQIEAQKLQAQEHEKEIRQNGRDSSVYRRVNESIQPSTPSG